MLVFSLEEKKTDKNCSEYLLVFHILGFQFKRISTQRNVRLLFRSAIELFVFEL